MAFSARNFVNFCLAVAVIEQTKVRPTTSSSSNGRLFSPRENPNIELCSIDSPSVSIARPAFSVARCAVQCNLLPNCNWFNYFNNDVVTCQLFSSLPVNLVVIPGCVLYALETTNPFSNHTFTNVSRGRPTWSSSDFGASPPCPQSYPGMAVDGNYDRNFGHCSCWWSQTAANQWWAIDLGREFQVYGVILTNRDDNGQGIGSAAASNFIVGLTNVAPNVTAPNSPSRYTQCGQWPSSVSTGLTMFVQCALFQPMFRYVVVTATHITLGFCEIDIFV